MIDPNVSQIIAQISLRVGNLEDSSGYKFWIPVGISTFAAIISLIAMWKSDKAVKDQIAQATIQNTQAKEAALQSVLQAVKSNIDSAKNQLESLTMEIAPLKANSNLTTDQQKELSIKEQVFNAVLERLLNAYNDGCQKYFKDQVKRQDFIDLYHQDISDYIREFPEKFSPPLTRFDAMYQYFEQKHKQAQP